MSDRKSDVSLDLLRTFLAVHRTGTLTDAARSLGMAQATVSAQLQALETAIGARLFVRLPRGVAPTPLADDLASRLAAPLDSVTAVVAALTGRGAAPRGQQPPVRLGGPAEFLAIAALPALAPLVADGVRLWTTTGLSGDLLEAVRAGRQDLVISTYRPKGRTLHAEPLADEEFLLVAAPDLAKRLGPPTANSLGGIPLLAYADDLPILRRYWRHVFGTRLEAQPAVVAPDLRAIAEMAASGAGVSVLPHYLSRPYLENGRLVPLLDPADPPTNTGFLVSRPGAPRAPHVSLVRDRLLEASAAWR